MFQRLFGSVWRSLQTSATKLKNFNEAVAAKLRVPVGLVAGLQIGAPLGFGFTMIQVEEYAAAVFFWVVLALVLVARIIGRPSDPKHPVRTIITRICLGFSAIGFSVLLITWTNIKRSDRPWSAFPRPKLVAISKPESTPERSEPFNVACESIFFASSTDKISLFWIVIEGGAPSATIKVPLSAMCYLRLVNLQSVSSVLNELNVEAETIDGQWIRLATLEGGNVFFVPFDPQDPKETPLFKRAMLFEMVPFDLLVRGRALAPRETVRGWIYLIYPRKDPPKRVTGKLRFTVSDTTGATYKQSTAGKPGNMGDASFVARARFDISAYPTRLIQDVPNYWTKP
ncbi:MAG: hypothetical protein LAO06_20485 [Acidobacteriia bacterium]|nr:hypothetical protein [Terriglobia bacterium]